MPVYTVHEAKAQFSMLIERAERGEEIVIARAGKPVVKLMAIEIRQKPRREPGMLKGVIPEIPDSVFLDPLTEEELKLLGEDGPEAELVKEVMGGAPLASS